jgi:hypothetical protein
MSYSETFKAIKALEEFAGIPSPPTDKKKPKASVPFSPTPDVHIKNAPDGEVSSGGKAGPSQATKIVAMAERAGIELWRTPDGDAFASVKVHKKPDDKGEEYIENWPLNSMQLRKLLAYEYYKLYSSSPGSQALQDALGVLGGQALFEGEEKSVYTRVAEVDGKVYLDLADNQWRAVEITKTGWEVISNPPVKFRRSRGMLWLPEPKEGGTLEGFRDFINVKSAGDFALAMGWLVHIIREKGPFAIATITGEQGVAKTTASRVLRSVVDPYKAAIRAAPREERDLVIAATNSWIVAIDNLSSIAEWLSDALSRLATGAGLSTRELYTDDSEKIFDVMRPIIISAITDVVEKSDLLDRRVNFALPIIEEKDRIPEKEFWPKYEKARPALLGALLDAVSLSLANEASVVMPEKPRMADFAIRAVAAEDAFGKDKGTFFTAYKENRLHAHVQAIEAHPIGPFLRQIADAGFKGTATQLLAKLNSLADEKLQKTLEWPKRANRVSAIVTMLAPNFRALKYVAEHFKETNTLRQIVLGIAGENIVWPVSTVSPDTKSETMAGDPSSHFHAYEDEEDDRDDVFPTSSKQATFDDADEPHEEV